MNPALNSCIIAAVTTRAAAVQLPFAFVSTPQEFMDGVREPVERAASARAQLIVLPAFSGYELFGILAPELEGVRRFDLSQIALAHHLDSVPILMRERGSFVYELYVHVFQSLAERTGTWIVPGTIAQVSDGEWHNTALLFSPDGRLIGEQRQAHRSAAERAAGMAAGTDLRVFETEAGRVGLVVGEDVRYPEVSRILALKGANLFAHPAAADNAGGQQFLVDLWREVQSNQVFGVQANLAAENLAGRSAIYGPIEITPDRSGILARAASVSQREIVAADLDFEALQKVVDEYPIFDFFNHEFYRRAFPDIYRNEP